MPKKPVTPHAFYVGKKLGKPVPWNMEEREALHEKDEYGEKQNWLLHRKVRQFPEKNRSGFTYFGLTQAVSAALEFWPDANNPCLLMMPGAETLRLNRVTKVNYEDIDFLTSSGGTIIDRLRSGGGPYLQHRAGDALLPAIVSVIRLHGKEYLPYGVRSDSFSESWGSESVDNSQLMWSLKHGYEIADSNYMIQDLIEAARYAESVLPAKIRAKLDDLDKRTEKTRLFESMYTQGFRDFETYAAERLERALLALEIEEAMYCDPIIGYGRENPARNVGFDTAFSRAWSSVQMFMSTFGPGVKDNFCGSSAALRHLLKKYFKDIVRGWRRAAASGLRSFSKEEEWIVQPTRRYSDKQYFTFLEGGGTGGYGVDFNVPANSLILTVSYDFNRNEGISDSGMRLQGDEGLWGKRAPFANEMIGSYNWVGYWVVLIEKNPTSKRPFNVGPYSDDKNFIADRVTGSMINNLYTQSVWTHDLIDDFIRDVARIGREQYEPFLKMGQMTEDDIPYKITVYPSNPVWWRR